MTPAKDKAIQLVNSFDELGRDFTRGVSMKEFSKQCALIAVDELIKALRKDLAIFELGKGFWYNVKLEIEKL